MDNIEQNNPQTANYQSTAILRELSDIKANLAVNSTQTDNIKGSIAEIKIDIRDIKADLVGRREFTEFKSENDKILLTLNTQVGSNTGRIRKLEDWKIWVIAYATGISATIYFLLNYFFKK